MIQSSLGATEKPSLDLTYFQQLPKVELHLHLGGSFPLKYLLSLANPEQEKQLLNHLELIAKKVPYQEVFPLFNIISQIVNSEDKVQNGVEALCKTLQEDGVVYAEIRTGLKNLGKGLEEYLKAVLRGIDAGASDKFSAKAFLSLQRNSSLDWAKTTVDLALRYQNQGVAGIDLSGDSTLGHFQQILPELLRAKKAGLCLVVHIGESKDEKDQIYLLKQLMPDRIGHGVHLTDEAKEWVLMHRTPLEICLTSSVLVQMIENYNDHPGLTLFQEGHPVVLCTDDPLLFSTSLSKELHFAYTNTKLSLEEIEKILQDSFKYAIKP